MFFLIWLPQISSAQCAGENGSVTICDIANPANQAVNLFALLGGSPDTGGTWSDPLQTGALNPTTGVLNIWQMHFSGTFTFTYTVTAAGCADNISTVAVTLGGYSGVPSPDGSACNDDDAVNLFQFFIGIMPDPQFNGTWSDDDNTGSLTGNYLDATTSGLGTFRFTYTMPAIGSCPAMSSTVSLTVYRKPIPGNPLDLILCSTDDLSQYTNVNLADQLSGEDANGLWGESSTSELSSMFDPFINVENIYATNGPGTYLFTYTVYPTNPVCNIETATIQVIIEEPLDFTGAVLTINDDICEDAMETATYSASMTQGTVINPAGPYNIVYEIESEEGTTSHTLTNISFIGGVMTFPIDKINFPEVGTYTVRIVEIVYTLNKDACDNIIDASDELHIYPVPEIDEATLTIAAVCEGSDVTVQLSGNTNLADGQYEINYGLTGANTSPTQTVTITVLAGGATFTIPAALLPNSGTTVIRIEVVRNELTQCEKPSTLAKSFTINPVVTINPVLSIANFCQNRTVAAQLTGLGSLTDIDITYSISGANTVASETINAIASNGTVVFAIPAALVPNTGASTATVTIISNHVTGCPSIFDPVTDGFTINEVPPAPAASDMTFCSAAGATVSNLVPAGNAYDWFLGESSTTPVGPDTTLVQGIYYVSQRNEFCSSERTMITVNIIEVPSPTLINDGQNFCGIDNPTIKNLSANIEGQTVVRWFEDEAGSNELPETHPLQNNAVYYGFAIDNIFDCESSQALSVIVSLTDCDENSYDFFIPDGFSPNSDGVNDTWRIPEIEFLFPDYTYEIYNRYGVLMFKGNINRPTWDGRNSESKSLLDGIVANGVYYYILNFNKDNAPARQGHLYLNR